MNIKSIELTHEKYKAIQPKTIESWEGYDWFPKKKKAGCKIEWVVKYMLKK